MAQLPIVRADVEGYLGVPATAAEQPWVDAAAEAASAFAARHVLGASDAELVAGGTPVEVDASVRLGAVMLAGRWFQRRNSLTGVAGFGDFGPAYVKAYDPDAATLLGLFRPGVA